MRKRLTLLEGSRSLRYGMTVLLLVWATIAHAGPTFPALTGRVVDDAHLLSPASIDKLTGELQAEEQRNGDQLVVVTLPSLQGQEIEDYGFQLGRAWGIGQKGKNNGALLIVAPSEHRTRIEVGYGLEGTLTDAATSTIINTLMLPAFKAGQYDQGIVQGTEAVLNVLQGGEPPAPAPSPQDEHSKFPALLLIGLVILLMCFRGGRSFLTTMLIFSSFGGGRGGGGSGGFGGGGGSFGGGGASGRW